MKRQDFGGKFFWKNCAKYRLDPEPQTKPEPKLLQSRNRNRNKSLLFHNTGEKSKEIELCT
jgi:hypothetical protein